MKSDPSSDAAGNPRDLWVEDGLRALREQAPSDDSRRATLARLGIAVTPRPVLPTRTNAERVLRGLGTALPWLLFGLILGAAVLWLSG